MTKIVSINGNPLPQLLVDPIDGEPAVVVFDWDDRKWREVASSVRDFADSLADNRCIASLIHADFVAKGNEY